LESAKNEQTLTIEGLKNDLKIHKHADKLDLKLQEKSLELKKGEDTLVREFPNFAQIDKFVKVLVQVKVVGDDITSKFFGAQQKIITLML
jgi:hypothetical protein